MTPLSSFANTLIPLFISLIKKLDQHALDPLKAHVHKVVCFDIQNIITLYFLIEDDKLRLIDKPEHVDATFTGPLNAFMTTLFTKQRTQTGLHIKGDLDCAKAFYDCTQHLDIDWEGHLAKGLGDNMAHMVATGFKDATQWAKETFDARTQDLGAYLQDEKELLPTRLEVEAFYKEVDVLRHDVERFVATVSHLQEKK
jgi:ubiquinone biosynthesis protein UbiJ